MGCHIYLFNAGGTEVPVPWIRVPPAFYDKEYRTPEDTIAFLDDLAAGRYWCGRRDGICGIGEPPVPPNGVCCSICVCGKDYGSDAKFVELRSMVERMRDDGTFGRLETG